MGMLSKKTLFCMLAAASLTSCTVDSKKSKAVRFEEQAALAFDETGYVMRGSSGDIQQTLNGKQKTYIVNYTQSPLQRDFEVSVKINGKGVVKVTELEKHGNRPVVHVHSGVSESSWLNH